MSFSLTNLIVFILLVMKKTFLSISTCLFVQCVFAQNQNNSNPDTSIRSIELGEIVIKSRETAKLSNKVRSKNVFIELTPAQPGMERSKADSTFYLTRFQQPETAPISPYSVEIRLKPFDTAMFDINLVVFQVNGKDTLFRIIPVDGSKIDQKEKLRVLLLEENMILQPGDFYIGYNFHSKHIAENFRYRLYATNKGTGALLSVTAAGTKLQSDLGMPFVFPFKMAYRKS